MPASTWAIKVRLDFGSLWGHYGLQTASEIWNQWPQLPAYPCAYCLYGVGPFGSLWGHHSLQTAPEFKSGLRFEISDPIYLLIHVHIDYMIWALLAASEAITASKQPQRSNMTSDLNSGTQITYFSMSTLLTCVAIAAGNKPFRHFVGHHNNRHQRNYVKNRAKPLLLREQVHRRSALRNTVGFNAVHTRKDTPTWIRY